MNKNIIGGLFLIALGAIFLLETAGVIDNIWATMWPIFLLIPAIVFHYLFFINKNENAGILVPGGILLVLSGLFFFHTLTGWDSSANTWPIYLFAVAFGLFEFYLFGEREWALLIPVFILAVTGTVFLLNNLISIPFGSIWPIFLIGAGIFMIFKRNTN